jgi:hypothetical protein
MFGGHPNLAMREPKHIGSTENEVDHVIETYFLDFLFFNHSPYLIKTLRRVLSPFTFCPMIKLLKN